MFTNHKSLKSTVTALSTIGLTFALATSAIAGDYTTSQDWAASASDLVQNNMSYPNMAEYRGESGTAYVRVKIDARGSVQDVWLTETSGSKRLDKAAVETVQKIEQFPATNFTSDDETTFTVSLNYVMEHGMRRAPSTTNQKRGYVKARDVADAGSNEIYASISFEQAEG